MQDPLTANPLKSLLLAIAIAMLVFGSSKMVLADSVQHRWVGDLPIMDGMTIEPELGFAFDSPGGRIVLVFASGVDDARAVMAFYNTALESLGWRGGGGVWKRGEELLTITQVEMAGGQLWRIRLSPQ